MLFIYQSFFLHLLKYTWIIIFYIYLLVLLSCKDFKSWESKYTPNISIKFEEEKDVWVPHLPKNLHSVRISKMFQENYFVAFLESEYNKSIEISNNILNIPLNPNTDTVNFFIVSSYNNNDFYQKVTVQYKRKASLISHKAGGLQIQYIIKKIRFHTINNKKPIFKKFSIVVDVPLKEHTKYKKTHVTFYY